MRRASWRSVPMMCRPPRLTTSLCSSSRLALEVRVDAIPVRPLDAVERVDVEEVDVFVVVDVLLFALGDLFGDAFVQRLLTRHVLGVAAEQDVGAAAGHVGGDRDGAFAAGLRDDLRFLRVVLGVEHDVFRALAS